MRALRRRWWATLTLGVATLLVLAAALRRAGEESGLWLVAAVPVLAYTFALLGSGLDENRHTSKPQRLLPTFGTGTGLTLARAIALAALSGFLPLPWPGSARAWLPIAWLPMALYTFVVIADWLDGYLARRSDHTTRLGATLDLELDALATLIAVTLAIRYGQLPLWYLLVGLARYLYVIAVWTTAARGGEIHELPPSRNRRLWAGFQMGFSSAVLWPIVPSEGAHIAAAWFGSPFLLGFLRDGLVVTGRVDPESTRYLLLRRLWGRVENWLPPILRSALVLVVLGWASGWVAPFQPPGWSETIAAWGWHARDHWQTLGAALLLLGTAMAGLGLLARLGALATLFGFAVEVSAHGLQPDTTIALGSTLGVLLLGSGALSIWRPEETALRRHFGEPVRKRRRSAARSGEHDLHGLE